MELCKTQLTEQSYLNLPASSLFHIIMPMQLKAPRRKQQIPSFIKLIWIKQTLFGGGGERPKQTIQNKHIYTQPVSAGSISQLQVWCLRAVSCMMQGTQSVCISSKPSPQQKLADKLHGMPAYVMLTDNSEFNKSSNYLLDACQRQQFPYMEEMKVWVIHELISKLQPDCPVPSASI